MSTGHATMQRMEFPIREISHDTFPPLLNEIPDPPQKLYVRGTLPSSDLKLLVVVGSRNYTDYGKEVTDSLISGLRGAPVGVVSGLALGIDGLAHRTALDANLYTLAIPGSGLDDSVLYPRRHHALAREILSSGGGLLSEYEPLFRAARWSFPKRNRLMAGIAHVVLVVEASEHSGTLITSRLATDYNRDVLAVPGSIFSTNTAGPHMLIGLGATPVTSADDILDALNLERRVPQDVPHPAGLSPDEQKVLEILTEPRDRDTLIRLLNINASQANILLMQMEMNGYIADHNGLLVKT